MSGMRLPTATYRLQLNRRFRFADALSLVSYLHRLGISDLYTSPIMKARSGSAHGYDVTDPTRLNPELGTVSDFQALTRELERHRMGLLLDIVPNHMALSSENPFWMDFLEYGFCSTYVLFFDIFPQSDNHGENSKVILPVLGCNLEEALKSGEVVLALDESGFYVKYHDHRFPLDVKSYSRILSHILDAAQGWPSAEHSRPLRQLMEALDKLTPPPKIKAEQSTAEYHKRRKLKRDFINFLNSSKELRSLLRDIVGWFNGGRGKRKDYTRLQELLEQQVYRLEFWKTGREKINYRRFFDINDLIGIRVELPEVLETTHRLLFKLVREGKVTGLRIDHIDGLRYPLAYLRRLQESAGELYVLVEKILSGDEVLSEEWPVCGTTGYDFMNKVNALFVNGRGLRVLDDTYAKSLGTQVSFDELVYAKKKQVINQLFPGEIRYLSHRLVRLAGPEEGFTPEEMAATLAEVIACLPVYRTYVHDFEVSPRDRSYLEHAFQEVRRRCPGLSARAVEFLCRVLFFDFPPNLTQEEKNEWLKFVLSWQQLTGSVMAKGFEDTALYAYNRLVSLNEVGGAPDDAVIGIDQFHQWNAGRLAYWPHTLNATSTHDSKRSEDVRARINVLSELPEEWSAHVNNWQKWNRSKKHRVRGRLVPEPAMEFLYYQTLLGAWPLRKNEIPGFKSRLQAYLVKAAREAKTFSSWLDPDLRYEDALCAFVQATLEPGPENRFIYDFLPFFEKVAFYGALNSLGQVLLKITLPGVPDFYQGTELWDLSLVDPDNRRPINFRKQQRLLEGLIQREERGRKRLIELMLKSWDDGRVKLYLIHKSLHFRRANQDLFQRGDYVPLEVSGEKREHIFAFARRKGERWVAVVVPRFVAGLVGPETFPIGHAVWKNDNLKLPLGSAQCWHNVITGEELEAGTKMDLALADILSIFPLALLESR